MKTIIKLLILPILILNILDCFSFDCDYISQTDTNKPMEIYLGKKYPQPFPMPNYIEFGSKDTAYITLNIYDLKGDTIREGIRCIISGGNYKFDWSKFLYVTDAPSGVYFIKMDAFLPSNIKSLIFTDNKKVLVVK